MMIKDKQITIFIIAVLMLSSFITTAAYLSGNANLSFLSVVTPSLVALTLVLRTDGTKGAKALFIGQLIQPFHAHWFLIALFVFPFIGISAVGLHSLAGGPTLELRSSQMLPQLIVIVLISIGEEFGWRAYLLPKLQEKYSALVASLIIAAVWSMWHFPASLIDTGVPLEMPFWVFMAWVLTATLLMTWVYNNTGSVLLAIVMHSMANATFNYLPLLPEFVSQINTFYIFLLMMGLLVLVVVPRLNKNESQNVN